MSNKSEANPANSVALEATVAIPAADPPTVEGETHRHPFRVETEDWKNTPTKVQDVFGELLAELERTYEIIRFLLGDKYGPKSEKSKKHDRKESGESESEFADETPAADDIEGTGTKAKESTGRDSENAPEIGIDLTPPPPPPAALGRKKLPASLPRRQVILDVLGAEKLCACCGQERPSFFSDDDTSERYGYIPAQFFVWQYKRRKYGACPCAGRIRKAEGPEVSDASITPPVSDQADATILRPTLDTPLTDTAADTQTAAAEAEATTTNFAAEVAETQPDPTALTAGLQSVSSPSSEVGSAIQLTLLQTAPEVSPIQRATLATVAKSSVASLIQLPSGESTVDYRPAVLAAPPLPQLIRKGLPSHGLLVDIIVKKVQDGMPIYRQAAQFFRSGVDLKRSTMSGWLIKVGRLLAPIMVALRLEVLLARCVHIDETPFTVLEELSKKNTAKAYMWVFAGGPAGKPAVEFRYNSSRSSNVPRIYMDGYRGDVLTDGYTGYDFLEKWDDIVLLACWVHVRRKFHDVIKAIPLKFRGKKSIANQALERIRFLYRLEKYADRHHFTEEQRRDLRQKYAKPAIDAMKVWLDEVKPTVPVSTKLGEAIGYALNQWPRLEHYVNTGYRPLDNNWIENLIRPFAVGRKAWLFSATVEGARALATLHSLVATAIVNGLDPGKYLRALFDQFAELLERSHPIHGPTPEQCRSLLPQYIDRTFLQAPLPEDELLLAAFTGAKDLAAAA
jgi:transposase